MAIDMNKPLDSRSPEADAFLKGLQGNILKSHGRDHAWHLIISFGTPDTQEAWETGRRAAKQWINGIVADGRIINALTQKGLDKEKDDFHTLLLSSHGYQFLGEKRPKEGAFRDGMRERASKLHDPDFEDWEAAYQHKAEDIHALVILANNDTAKLEAAKAKIESGLAGFGGRVLVAERGHQLRDNENRAIEHFGYADGVSQPQFIDDGSEPRRTKFSQLTPLRRVLDQDRLVDGEFGSFLVYRKLEQNVKTFNAAVQNVANQTSGDPILAGAQAVGRFKNGTPITTHPTPKQGYDPNNDEDFNYDRDEGGRCPLHAHIRKTNPRDSLGLIVAFLANEETRRIARRGITYGERPDFNGVGGVPSGGVGLIFLCYQNDIKDQFEFMQKEWANDPSFPNIFKGRSGIDPVIAKIRAGKETVTIPTGQLGGTRPAEIVNA